MFVKICGITHEEDALLAVAMGADAVGFVFAPSPRQIAIGAARDIARRLHPEVITVGVFRDAAPQRVVDVVFGAGLRAAQLSGHESPQDVAFVAQKVPLVIKALHTSPTSLDDPSEYRADAIYVELPSQLPSRIFDWRLAERIPNGTRLMIGGAIDAENVAEAIARVHPWGVDASATVETAARKDPRKVRAFIQAAKNAAPAPSRSPNEPYDWQEDW